MLSLFVLKRFFKLFQYLWIMNPIKKRDQKLSVVLGKLIETNPLVSEHLIRLRVESAFRENMGIVINKYTSKILYRKGTLTLIVVSAPLRQELAQSTHKIIQVINDSLGHAASHKVVLK